MALGLTAWTLPLRAWQRDAFAAWLQARPPDALIVATPGSGKTRFAARLAHEALASRNVARVIVVVPREHLKAQVARVMAEGSVELDHHFKNATGVLAPDVHGVVVTYQQVALAPHVFRRLTQTSALVILDEIHHAGEEATWGAALRTAFEAARFRVALSGTPFRSDGSPIPFVRYAAGLSQADYSYDYASALADGVCRALVFPLHGGEAEWISRDGRAMNASFEVALERRLEGERLRTALTQPAWIGDVLQRAHLKLLALRMGGDPHAAGLVAAMNQDHARFIAELMHRRIGVSPEIVVSDIDDASRRISAFARSRDPWIVAVHMISEGVDIPRLRVGVFASNVVTEMYFRQFCGRFVRTTGERSDGDAFVYAPDDARIRALASRITLDVRTAVRADTEADDVGMLALAQRAERAAGEGDYASIHATAVESQTLDFGPLFNPAALEAPKGESERGAVPPPPHDGLTHAERKVLVRREIAALVGRVSSQFSVDHKWIHATLNERCGGPIATATLAELEGRRRVASAWLARAMYDGIRDARRRA